MTDVVLDQRNTGHAFEGAYAMLNYIYDKLDYAESLIEDPEANWESLGTFTSFPQQEFFPDITERQWRNDGNFKDRDNGYLYVPNACGTAAKQCKLHFALHGCGGSPKGFATNNGYNALGAMNDIIMVYPDTRCWDGPNGIDTDNYDTNYGIVPNAFKSIVDRVTESGDDSGLVLDTWLDEQQIADHD